MTARIPLDGVHILLAQALLEKSQANISGANEGRDLIPNDLQSDTEQDERSPSKGGSNLLVEDEDEESCRTVDSNSVDSDIEARTDDSDGQASMAADKDASGRIRNLAKSPTSAISSPAESIAVEQEVTRFPKRPKRLRGFYE